MRRLLVSLIMALSLLLAGVALSGEDKPTTNEIDGMFKSLDKDGDGRISREEWNRVDTNGDDKISPQEWEKHHTPSRWEIRWTDTDSDGFLEKKEYMSNFRR